MPSCVNLPVLVGSILLIDQVKYRDPIVSKIACGLADVESLDCFNVIFLSAIQVLMLIHGVKNA